MIPVQTCKFCHNSTAYVPLSIGDVGRGPSSALRVHFCNDCLAEYVYWASDGNLASIHLYTTINSKLYRWTVSHVSSKAYLWHYAEPGEPGVRSNKKGTLLKTFTVFHDITPQNVEEKIKFMLPFL